MTNWERKIIDAFISHYLSGASGAEENRKILRLRSSVFFPGFNTASPDEKESYLEAAETLEQKGIAKLSWEKRSKKNQLKTLSCENFEKLFLEAGKTFPKTEAEKIRDILKIKTEELTKSKLASTDMTGEAERIIKLLEFYSIHFCPREIGQGIDQQTMEDFILLLEFCCTSVRLEKITTRALSILLYRNSKRLENVLVLCKPLLSRAEKIISIPDLSFLERSYPETMISGKIIITYKNEKTPLVNPTGKILGIPLEHTEEIENIQLVPSRTSASVLTIENKETFYALAAPQRHDAVKTLSRFDCFLYVGGYSNRATAAVIKTLSASGFSFYHAGDLDPDGILILQHIQEIAGKPVIPLHMDTATFNKYLPWARTLTKPMLQQMEKIREETRAIPELAGLLQRIEETGLGVEQEIVDYR